MISPTLSKAWTAFKSNKRYLLLTILLELIFLLAVIQTHYVFFKPTAEVALKIGDVMSKTVSELSEEELMNFNEKLMQNEEFITQYHLLLKYVAYFLLSMLAIWIIFKTPIWYLAHKTIYKEMPFTTHATKFILLSIFWCIIIIAILIAYTAAGSTSITAITLAIILLLLILYFSQISFSLIPNQQTFKNTFIFGIKHARAILPAFIINLVLNSIAIYLPFIWLQSIPLLSLAIIILITVPVLAYTRLNMIIATWQKI